MDTEKLLQGKEKDPAPHVNLLAGVQGTSLLFRQRAPFAWLVYQTFLHLTLLVSVASVVVIRFRSSRALISTSYTPAADVAHFYQSTEYAEDHSHSSIYSGEPTKENVAAWDNLVDPTFIALTPEEIIRAGASLDHAVRLADYKDKFIGGLGVYHNLHCVRQLRFWVYRDYYYSNLTESQIASNTRHLGHCIESLRVAIMCAADLTLYTFKWEESEQIRPSPKAYTTRQCLHWDSLDTWSRERSIGYYPWLLRPGRSSESVHMI